MKFIKLNIENFLVLTEASIGLADRGLVLIQGVNAADSSALSNGAGKSSIADALCWSLYGVTARGESGDQVVNNNAGKNTRVEVMIDDDGAQYRIVRHRKHKTGKNNVHVFLNDGSGEKDITKGTDKLTQDLIEKIIGASLEVFTGSIYAGQEKMPDLPGMTDKLLKVLIEEASGVTVLEGAYVKARDNARAAKADLDQAVMVRDAWQAKLQAAENYRNSMVKADADWLVNRDAQVKEVTDRVRDELLPAAKQLQAEAPQSEIDNLAALIQTADGKIASVGQEQADLGRLASIVGAAQRDSFAAATKLQAAQRRLDVANKALATAQHGVNCACPTCEQPMPLSSVNMAITRAQIEVDNAEADVTALMTAADIAESASQRAQSTHDTFKLGMTDVSAEVAQRAAYEAQRASLMVKETKRQQIVATAKSEMASIARLKAEVSPFVAKVAAAQSAVDDIRNEIANSSGTIASKQEVYDLENEVVRVFSPSGVRARVLDEVTPYLNAQTSKYLSILSDGNINAEWSTLTMNKAGETKEKFAIEVSSSISSKTFKGLSGGEKRKVRVATALALQDLVSTRASKPIDLFVGDEIDHALDSSGLERLMVILDEKAKERGTVMVISHNSLRDEISNVLTVERTAAGETKIIETAG